MVEQIVTKGYKPEKVLAYFEELCKIPHGSGNEEAVAKYIENFAKERNLFVIRDKNNNVFIRKDATVGYENAPAYLLQGHTDMVTEKTVDCPKDMDTEGLDLYLDGDLLRAKGTTLGGDDGVAVAYALALLDSTDIPHPALEALFTSDEEVGLIGAVALDGSQLSGRVMINVDSDVEGVFTVGCAGGLRSDLTLSVERGETTDKYYRLTLTGLKGGHSGTEIDKGRANAIKQILGVVGQLSDLRLISLLGGNADNAIPRDAEVCFTTSDSADEIASVISDCTARLNASEPGAVFELTEISGETNPLTIESTETAVAMLCELPTGVIAMSEDIPGLVETSLNLGIVKLDESELHASHSVRSAKGESKRLLTERLFKIGEKYGAKTGTRGEYPAWEYKADSHLRDVMVSLYREKYGKDPEVLIIHAGLECGIFSEKLPGLDCVSIGPDNLDIHTPEERLSVSSTERVWDFLLEVLRKI